MDTQKLQVSFFIGLLLAALLLAGALFLPFMAPIALAFTLAVVARPAHLRVLKALKGRRTLASFATILLILIVVFIPISVLVQQIFIESYELYGRLASGQATSLDAVTEAIAAPIRSFYPAFNPDLEGYLETAISKFVDNLGTVLSSTATILLGGFLTLIALFYILRDGHRFRKAVIELSPLADKYDRQIIDRLERAINSVVRGSFLISVTQGTLVGLGFFIFGIPNAFLWGTVAAFSAFLPGLGTGLVVVPGVIYLVLTGSVGMAVGLGVWGAVIVGLVDNILMPALVGRGFMVHPLFVLFSILGGLAFFGPVGLFLGPLIIALLFALFEIYKLIILDDQHRKETSI